MTSSCIRIKCGPGKLRRRDERGYLAPPYTWNPQAKYQGIVRTEVELPSNVRHLIIHFHPGRR
ncbi:hypothetical protein C8Q75DRAFT_789971 [Abortiporus biennis]|nr:hypothetical protein C8Q75DRAFT_789971 [Abortiporus biennis]